MDVIRRTSPGPLLPSPSPCGTVLFILWIAALLLTGTVRAQSAETPSDSTRIEFLKYGAMATNVAVSNDGNHIAIGARGAPEGEGLVVLWSRSLNERVWRRSFATENAPNVAFDSSGTRVAIAPGQGEVLIVRRKNGQTVERREMSSVPVEFRTALETDASTRRLAFGLGTSQAVLRSGDNQITVLNYKFNPKRTIETSNFCQGKVLEVKLPENTSNIYFTTKAYAECNPDYLCVVNPSADTLVNKYSRKNISQVEVLGNRGIAYSRGKYVYRFNRQTGVEEVVFTSENTVNDLSYANDHLVIANSDVVILEM